ncbi:hypothetical protein INT80_01680 [Gallibacterium anatis]|uniref:Uncharacterized protein n=1 Tax=Gallibacterium anatis TaxID=750 RepID=A0A930UQQ6_9PAST|nr:hypothetical protein [Gallibacterium anatis]
MEQAKQLGNPDARVLIEEISELVLLGKYVDVPQGIKTGDDNRFRIFFGKSQRLVKVEILSKYPN